ncbi:ATP-dependent DNA helicase RecG [bacterium]|nr:ATP-dependent DNA helicase RecG [bacterium]
MPRNPPPLDLPVEYVRGIGPKRAAAFKKVGVRSLRDLLFYAPRRYLDRSTAIPIRELHGPSEEEVTVVGTVIDTRETKMRKGGTRYEALLDDGLSSLTLVWFKHTSGIRKWITTGYSAAFSGKVVEFNRFLQMVHPDVTELSKGEVSDLLAGKGRWVAIYPGNKELDKAGLDMRGLRTLMDRIVGEYLPDIEDFWTEEDRIKFEIPELEKALMAVHRPRSAEDHLMGWNRLKLDELVMLQLTWVYAKEHRRQRARGISYPEVGKTTRAMIEKLPFKLTETQRKILREIWSDMTSPHAMSRLLQGDVGSGKTVVALIAMTIAVENGYQAALMVPTEILAEQHYLTSRKFLKGLGVHVELLLGGSKTKAKQEQLDRIASGKPCIVIGTHALIQDAVNFSRLGFVVIDEQHRFGVTQRMKLMDPGMEQRPDVLVMTATPIPRSLGLTLYGDLDVSRLDEMPPGRGKISTIAINGKTGRAEMYAEVRKQVENGGQAYIVFPLVEESEKLDLQAAVESKADLEQTYLKGLPLGLLHGRMKLTEKEEAMAKFVRGETKILVSTTVIEVGVDVENATEMVVEHAERFGLAQLHQLRGRVGRGGRDSRCYLVGYPEITETARARIRTLVRTNDGFEVAEEDLRIRGAGDFFGVRQHGLPELRYADIVADQGLLIKARNIADQIIEDDPTLKKRPKLKAEFSRTAAKKVTWLEIA